MMTLSRRQFMSVAGGGLTVALAGFLPGIPSMVVGAQQVGNGAQAAVVREYWPKEGDGTASAGSVSLWAGITQYDTEEHAKAGYSALVDDRNTTLDPVPQGHTLARLELGKELGNERSSMRLAGETTDANTRDDLFIRDGTTTYWFNAVFEGRSSVEDVDKALEAFATTIVKRPAGTSAAVFHDDGTSTGGLFEKFPPADDPVLLGLVVQDDRDVLAEGGWF